MNYYGRCHPEQSRGISSFLKIRNVLKEKYSLRALFLYVKLCGVFIYFYVIYCMGILKWIAWLVWLRKKYSQVNYSISPKNLLSWKYIGNMVGFLRRGEFYAKEKEDHFFNVFRYNTNQFIVYTSFIYKI